MVALRSGLSRIKDKYSIPENEELYRSTCNNCDFSKLTSDLCGKKCPSCGKYKLVYFKRSSTVNKFKFSLLIEDIVFKLFMIFIILAIFAIIGYLIYSFVSKIIFPLLDFLKDFLI